MLTKGMTDVKIVISGKALNSSKELDKGQRRIFDLDNRSSVKLYVPDNIALK